MAHNTQEEVLELPGSKVAYGYRLILAPAVLARNPCSAAPAPAFATRAGNLGFHAGMLRRELQLKVAAGRIQFRCRRKKYNVIKKMLMKKMGLVLSVELRVNPFAP